MQGAGLEHPGETVWWSERNPSRLPCVHIFSLKSRSEAKAPVLRCQAGAVCNDDATHQRVRPGGPAREALAGAPEHPPPAAPAGSALPASPRRAPGEDGAGGRRWTMWAGLGFRHDGHPQAAAGAGECGQAGDRGPERGLRRPPVGRAEPGRRRGDGGPYEPGLAFSCEVREAQGFRVGVRSSFPPPMLLSFALNLRNSHGRRWVLPGGQILLEHVERGDVGPPPACGAHLRPEEEREEDRE